MLDLEAERARLLGVHAAAARSFNLSAVKLKAPRRPSAARRWQRERPARVHDGTHASCTLPSLISNLPCEFQ